MYVDGEPKPSIAGTGSEDDFGGAWCYSHEFAYPLFGAPLRARFMDNDVLVHCTPDLRGKELDPWRWPQAWKPGDLWNVYRYHVDDAIPFRKSIRVNIEHGYINNERGDWLSSVAYWYQKGSPSSRVPLPPIEERMPRYLRSLDRGEGRWEGENFVDWAQTTGGKVQEVGMDFWGDLFSARGALEWNADKPGDTLTLTFVIEKPGPHRVSAKLAKIEPGGQFTVALDDRPAGEPVNLYQPPPFPGLFEVIVAETHLAAGKHTLRFTAQASDSKAKGMRLMLDNILVQPKATTTQPASATPK